MLADFPCIKRKWSHGGAAPSPLFGYQGSVRHHDLPFPDHTFWGHEYQYLQVCGAVLRPSLQFCRSTAQYLYSRGGLAWWPNGQAAGEQGQQGQQLHSAPLCPVAAAGAADWAAGRLNETCQHLLEPACS